jgi:osmoprotectant transport system substrate-binding protein
MREISGATVWALLALLLVGCSKVQEPIKIGSKDFIEQKLLAEMLSLLAEQEGIRVQRAIPYGDSWKCMEAVQRGVIDAYPEYNGTILALSGLPAGKNADEVSATARSLVEPLGLRWLEPLGLENSYALAVRRDLAISRELDDISDLTRLPEKLRFAVDDDYEVRPVDGLNALALRYGLDIGNVQVFPIADRKQPYRALAERKVDVAEVFSTDSQLDDYGVVALEDDLGFFPVYEPAPLVRDAVLDAFPALAEAWGGLAGRIDTATMRQLNGRVERAGEDYREVARSFLEGLGLLPERPAATKSKGSVTLAVSGLADLGYLPIRAAEAIREVMPARRLLVTNVPITAQAVRDGEARFGLVGAEEFYRITADGELVEATDIEAVGVVGTRLLHLVTPLDGEDPKQWRRLGVGPEGGGSWQVARLLLNAMDLAGQIELVASDDPLGLTQKLDSGEIDALVLMVERGHAGLTSILMAGGHRLVNVDAFRGNSPALRYPFLRPAIIPANSYPGQTEPLDMVAAQVVLATRVPARPDPIGESGPGFVPGVFTRLPQRLPFDTARRLSRALDTSEEVDPVLPISPGLLPETPPVKPRISAQPASALLNVLAILFLVSMVILYLRRLPPKPALSPGEKPPES